MHRACPGGKILIGRPATHGMIRTFEKKAHVLPAQSDVENDCVALAVRGETLVISGSNERSVYYSVCHLLQTYFGVGFYFDGDSCTASPDMTLPNLTLVERSSIQIPPYRGTVGVQLRRVSQQGGAAAGIGYVRAQQNQLLSFLQLEHLCAQAHISEDGCSDRTDHAGGYCAYGGDTGIRRSMHAPRYVQMVQMCQETSLEFRKVYPNARYFGCEWVKDDGAASADCSVPLS